MRGARDRDHGHDALPRGRAAALRHARRRAHLRAVPPALPDRAAGPRRRRARRTPSTRRSPRRCPIGAGQPVRARARAARHAAAHRAGGQAGLRLETQRAWKVVNDGVANGLGTPVGYKLVPGARFPPMLDPDSPVLQPRRGDRATRCGSRRSTADERWPCGEFVVQSGGRPSACPRWTARDRPIEDTDVVLWYVFGIHHITRPEDWPVMPVDTVSFWLKPFGFFDRNPALDVPPAPSHCHPRGGPMTTELSNFIHGERVAAADGRTTDLVDPSTGEVVRHRAAVGRGGHRRRVPRLRARVRGVARHDAERAPARAAADRRRDRGSAARSSWRSSRATPASRAQLTLSEEIPPMVRPDPLLRGRGARRSRAGRRASTWRASRRSSGASRSACARR